MGDSLEIMKLQDDLNSLLEKEEIYWRQRSRVSWISEGDKNTKYFHAQCNHRKKLNCVKGLRYNNGVWQTDRTKIAEIAMDYFQSIFSSANPNSATIASCLEGVEKVVSDEMNCQMLQDFSAEEVSQALTQMYPTKAPGPDGMSTIF